MTYRSLFVEEHPSRESANVSYGMGTPDEALFCSLNAYAWPISLAAFAEEHALRKDYVDNCWVRVAVEGATLRAFLQAGGRVDPDVPSLLARVNDNRWYVINEEEF